MISARSIISCLGACSCEASQCLQISGCSTTFFSPPAVLPGITSLHVGQPVVHVQCSLPRHDPIYSLAGHVPSNHLSSCHLVICYLPDDNEDDGVCCVGPVESASRRGPETARTRSFVAVARGCVQQRPISFPAGCPTSPVTS